MDMKNLKPRARTAPAEALAIAAQTAPSLPPAQMPPVADRASTMTLRMRVVARERGQTIKQVVAYALADAGVAVAAADLEDRTPRRRVPGTAA
jgi:hypothetical protein